MNGSFRVGDVDVRQINGAFVFAAGMAIDADGAPSAYHPPTKARPRSGRPPGLDDLRNAYEAHDDGSVRWFGVVTDAHGVPVVQGAADPCPGFYVSQTSLTDPSLAPTNPRRYVDSTLVPFVALPGRAFRGLARLGDLCVVSRGALTVGAIWADVGPPMHIGEGSIALATALGVFHGNVNDGHEPHDIIYSVFPGSASEPPWPRDLDDIHTSALKLLGAWGGTARLLALFPGLVGGSA